MSTMLENNRFASYYMKFDVGKGYAIKHNQKISVGLLKIYKQIICFIFSYLYH